MSVVVVQKDSPDRVIVLTKGADSAIYDLLDEEIDQFTFGATQIDIDKRFSLRGYRTLVVGMKVIPLDEYEVWATNYREE